MIVRCSLLLLLLLAGRAGAHGLHGTHRVLAGKRIQVEGWYSTNEPAAGATVQVLRSDGSLLAEDKLDANGLWVFAFKTVEDLKVVIRHDGHLARFTIAAQDLTTPLPWREVLSGVSFLLALAAFLLSWRNSRRLRALRAHSPS